MNDDPLDALIRQHAPFVWRVLLHLGVPEPHLDDACQEVLLVVCRKLAGFEGRSSLRTWIYAICKNTARAFFRVQALERERAGADCADVSVVATQDQTLSAKQAHEELLQVLGTLSDEQRAVFILYEIEEESMEEVARSLGAPVSTCYSRLHTARAKVEAHMRRRRRGQLRIVAGGDR